MNSTIDMSRSILGAIDAPASDQVAVDIVIAGWAFSPASPVARVEIWLGDRFISRAGLARPRPAIAAALANEAAELSGFELRIESGHPDLPRGEVEVRARVVLLNGEHADLPAVRLTLNSQLERLPAPLRGGPIRLLCIAQSLDRGGSQLRMRELVAFLARTGEFDVAVASPREGPLRHELEQADALVRVAPLPLHDVSAYEEQLENLVGWAAGRFDVTLGFTLTCFAAVELAERLGIPSLWRIGDCKPLATVVKWLGGRLDRAVERRADRAFSVASAVMFNSANALRFFEGMGHFGRFLVLGSGTDTEGAASYLQKTDRNTCRRALGLAPDRRVVLWAGTIWPVKAQALLVSAVAELRDEHPELLCVLIGQQDEPYAASLSRLIDRLGLANSVRILPFEDDLRPWRCAADAAVCASEHESMSGSILEAMAFGLPVLATRVGGADEVTEDGVTGWLCDPSDLASLVDGLRRVATATPGDLRILGAEARRRVQLAHDRRVAHRRTADLIKQVVKSGAQPRPVPKTETRPVQAAEPRSAASRRLETVNLLANHVIIVASAAEEERIVGVEIAALVSPIAVDATTCVRVAADSEDSVRGAREFKLFAVCSLDFDSAKLLCETADPVQVTVKFASGAAVHANVVVESVTDIALSGLQGAIDDICRTLSARSPDFARILASIAKGDHVVPQLPGRLDYHLVAPDCGFLAVGRVEGVASEGVMFLLDGMKLAVNPAQVFHNPRQDRFPTVPGQNGEPERPAHLFGCIETIEGVAHDLRLAALGEAGVRWSGSLELANTGTSRDLVTAVDELLSEEELLRLLSTSDILHQIAQHNSQPHAATVAVTEFTRCEWPAEFSVIIPFYRVSSFLLDHIESQRRTDARAEWIVVCDDPALLPGMLDACRERRSEMRKPTRLVSVSRNVGFAAANNIGIRHAAGDYVVLMNSDIYWSSFAPIEFAKEILCRDPTVGVVGFTLHFDDGSVQHAGMRLEATPELNDMLLLLHDGKGLPGVDRSAEMTCREVAAVTGALMVVRRKDFPDRVFSEDYIGGDFEDGDLCLDVRARGRRVMLVECEGLYHLERQSIGSHSPHRLLKFVNASRFSEKWHMDGTRRI